MKLSKTIITSALALSILGSTAFAVAPATSFSDVTSSHWAHSEITKAVDKGLFSGTTEPVNGVGTFAPDAPMTRAMFLVVVNRALGLPTEEISGVNWADAGIKSLIKNGVIESDNFNSEYNKAMTREEMAYVLANALEYTGETLNSNISKDRIPDYKTIGTYYRDEVLTAYSNGLLTGTDTQGTFDPAGTLNRAQAATVLVRLADKSSRKAPLSDAEYDKEMKPGVTEPDHEHTWVPITVHHEETGHYAIQYGERKVVKCGCGQQFYDQESFMAHHDAGTGDCPLSYSVETEKYETGKTWVVDQAAWDEVIGYKCECGASK